MRKVISLFAIIVLFNSCSTVPITGRKRVNFIKDEQVLPMSFSQYEKFLEENEVSSDPIKTEEVREVGRRISEAVVLFMNNNGMEKEAKSYQWEFNLVEDKALNAWCMPGGKVVFYTGILPIAKNEDGIAAIMGHEVAHAFAKHGQERMSSQQMQAIGAVAVAAGTSGESRNDQILWNVAYGLGSQLGMLKYSRQHETEADKLGMVFMIMAGYNPEEAVKVWERMKAESKGKTPEFLSTHPSNERRIHDLREFIPEAKDLAKRHS